MDYLQSYCLILSLEYTFGSIHAFMSPSASQCHFSTRGIKTTHGNGLKVAQNEMPTLLRGQFFEILIKLKAELKCLLLR